MTIGEASRACGVSAKMIRYYESIGLIGPAARTGGNYRAYGQDEIHQLRFGHRARALGFSLPDIARLLNLWRDRTRASAEVKRIALDQLALLHERIAHIQEVASTLQRLAEDCHGDDRPDCPIMDNLAALSPGPADAATPSR